MNRAVRKVMLVSAAVLAVVTGCALAGARINTTASYPVGLYWEVDAPIEKGAMVIFCPPEGPEFDDAKARGYIGAGFCQGGYGLMIKKVLAASGDHITVSDQGVCVNDELIPNSKPLNVDKAGRRMPRYRVGDYTLGAGQVLLMSDYSPHSFDARYFGPVGQSQIQSVIRPIFTW
jgi:conjugative transfer signal peptidase TraF